jgi:transposase-like protein
VIDSGALFMKSFLSVSAVARRWGVSPSSVRRLITAGKLATSRPTPGTVRVPMEAVLKAEAARPELTVTSISTSTSTATSAAPKLTA